MPVEFLWGGVVIVLIILGVRMIIVERKLRTLFRGGDAKTLEGLIGEHAERIEGLEHDTLLFKDALAHLEKRFLLSIQKVSVLRFNPFSESGGDQSFVIALLDDHNSGFVLSSLYFQGRQMLYAKPIDKGTSKYTLSDEEKTALANALGQA